MFRSRPWLPLSRRRLFAISRALLPIVVCLSLPRTGWADAPPVIRLLPPAPGATVEGPTVIDTLALEDELKVVFYLDGEQVGQRKAPPYSQKIRFASPPREQTVRVRALGAGGRQVGEDEMVVNLLDPPLRISITELDKGSPEVKVRVSVPRGAELARLAFFRNTEEIASLDAARPGPLQEETFNARLELAAPGPEDFLRAVAELADGRWVEDVELLAAPGLTEDVDVNLVQLQALVTHRHGPPVTDLELQDFEIRQRGAVQRPERLYRAQDVALFLGVLIDTSGSMAPIWRQTAAAATGFLRRTLGELDRAFLTRFDSQLERVHPLSGDLEALVAALGELRPNPGGLTALYDSVLYSLLELAGQPGRRALVVITDGFEVGSRSKPQKAVELGQRLGVPVYVIALEMGRGSQAQAAVQQGFALSSLKLITDPTGGRLLQVRSPDGLERAFEQINGELRHQYVLTYYTDSPPTGGRQREVEVRLPGRRDVEVRTVWALDQIH